MNMTITPQGERKLRTTKRERDTIANAAKVLKDLWTLKPTEFEGSDLARVQGWLVEAAGKLQEIQEDADAKKEAQH